MIKNTWILGLFTSLLVIFSSMSYGDSGEYGMDCEKPTITAQVGVTSTFEFNCKNTTGVTFGSYKIFPIPVSGATVTATACSDTIAPGALCLVQGTFTSSTSGVYEVDFDDEYGGERHDNIFCNSPEKGCVEAQVYYIGEYLPSEGGVVFYIDQNGGDTLIVALNDALAGALAWANAFNDVDTSYLIYSGATNTANMNDPVMNPGLSPAATACITYPDSHDDWYVPARAELNVLTHNKVPVNTTLETVSGASKILNTLYWSSSQLDPNHALSIDFSNGLPHFASKVNLNLVRCIRAF